MPTTITAAFEQLRRNLEITDLQEKVVSTRQQNVREAVERELKVLDSFLAGSYRRSTMIAPLKEADVDVFVVLDPEYFTSDGQAGLLDRVKRVLRETYPQTPDISRNGQAVTITFADFRVDVVPTFHRKGGGYLIPDSIGGRWIPTDPTRHVEIWAAANKGHNGDLVPLIKMLKGWNKSRDVFRSFHLETLALNVLDGVTITDFPSGVRYFFDKARSKIAVKVPDPADYSDDVGSHVDKQEAINAVTQRLEFAYERAIEAEALASGNQVEGAYAKWTKVFKEYFPAYG